MTNKDLASAFLEIADLMDIKGEDGFRVATYRKAARTISEQARDIREIAAEKGLAKLDGIGKSTQAKIEEYLATGDMEMLRSLRTEVPVGLKELLDVPGLGPKKVSLLWKELGVESMNALATAIDEGRLTGIKGMGEKTVKQIRDGITFLKQAEGRTPLGLALPLAQMIADSVRAIPGVERVEIAGSLRRGADTVGDVDLVCAADDGAKVIKAFVHLPYVVRIVSAGDTKGSVVVRRRDGKETRCQLRVVPSASFGAALQYFTGSKEHNVRLRERAAAKGWKLNEWGLYDGEHSIAGSDEAEIYKKLGLSCLPPEVREDRGEFDAPAAAFKLIERSDIRGDLHTHTSASDGTLSAAEMVKVAADMGYDYIAVTDHSKSSAVANGLSIDRMWRQIEKIRQLNTRLDSISVLVGCECDILPDGTMDYPDTILAACDIVVASIHSHMNQDRETVTKRMIAAMENPFVTIIGHPTTRLINRREPCDLDMEAVIAAAKRTGTVLELNSSWQRLDLNDRYVRMAREAGVMISINTDAHAPIQFEQIDFGIRIARRAWLQAKHVINTMPLPALKHFIAKKRKNAASTVE